MTKNNAHTVFNDQMELYGLRYLAKVSPIPSGPEYSQEHQRKLLLAVFFEQLLLFDSVAIKLKRTNYGLWFLINELGIDLVQNLIERGTLKLILWNAMLFISRGRQTEDGRIDETTVIGTPPLVAANYVESDSDPEKNIETALSYFIISRERKREFIRAVRDRYLLPKEEFASQATEIIVNAYESNRLSNLGLEYNKEANDLNIEERERLQKLGYDILDTSVLSDLGFKSYDTFEIFNITESSIKEIEGALKVASNTSTILTLENAPDLRSLIINNILPFKDIFDLRHKKVVKEYRRWISEVSTNENSLPITKAYIDEIVGKNNFFETNGGKFVRHLGVFVLGGGLGAAMGGITGGIAGTVIGKATDFGLGLFDTYLLDGLLKGWNPQMFVDEIKKLEK